jgi:alcohol dehydrogenase
MRYFYKVKHWLTLSFLTVLKKFLVFPDQVTFAGKDSAQQLCAHISRMDIESLLLVTDKILVDLGLAEPLVNTLQAKGVSVSIYDGVLPDPSLDIANAGFRLQQSQNCDAVLALGGGSSIDTAKAIAGGATHGGVEQVLGILKVKKIPLPLFAIPTTSGTGSEVSMAAVISDPTTHQKNVMADPAVVPLAIALDPLLMAGMPPAVTAATGIDALTHAIESYIGSWSDKQGKSYASAAIKAIFQALPIAYRTGSDLEARESMALAAYYAGLALNSGSVGNVHAIAHQLGSQYGVPHGLANAVLLPHVLDRYKNCSAKPLAELADLIGVSTPSDSVATKVDKFIVAVRDLNEQLCVPQGLKQVREEDYSALSLDAINESLQYPVPRLLSRLEIENILQLVKL